MRRTLRTLFLRMLLIGCGSPNAPPVGFLNETLHSTSDLWAIWTTAQNSVAKRVDMNPMQRFLYGAPANIRAGDARALAARIFAGARSEEHTSELQSRFDLVCRL